MISVRRSEAAALVCGMTRSAAWSRRSSPILFSSAWTVSNGILRETVCDLVYAATGSSVATVIVDGRVVMRRRVMLTVDAVRQASRAWWERGSFARRPRWPVV